MSQCRSNMGFGWISWPWDNIQQVEIFGEWPCGMRNTTTHHLSRTVGINLHKSDRFSHSLYCNSVTRFVLLHHRQRKSLKAVLVHFNRTTQRTGHVTGTAQICLLHSLFRARCVLNLIPPSSPPGIDILLTFPSAERSPGCCAWIMQAGTPQSTGTPVPS